MFEDIVDRLYDEFLEGIQEEILDRAEKDVEGVRYLVDLIQSDWGRFDLAFDLQEDPYLPDDKVPETLYKGVLDSVRRIEGHYLGDLFGPFLEVPRDEIPYDPAEELGWIDLVKVGVQGYPQRDFRMKLTDLGRKVIDGYRDASGYITLAEQLEFDKERKSI